MQGVGYTVDKRGCEGNQVAVRQPRAEQWQIEAVVPGGLGGRRNKRVPGSGGQGHPADL